MARFLWATVLAIVFAPLYRRLSRSMRQRHNLAAFTTVVIIMVIVILGGGPLHDASRAMPAMASSPRRACSVFWAMAPICARHDRGSSLALRRVGEAERTVIVPSGFSATRSTPWPSPMFKSRYENRLRTAPHGEF